MAEEYNKKTAGPKGTHVVFSSLPCRGYTNDKVRLHVINRAVPNFAVTRFWICGSNFSSAPSSLKSELLGLSAERFEQRKDMLVWASDLGVRVC